MKPSKNNCTIILVTFNSAHCISKLKFLNDLPNVVFVDNASEDRTCEFISAEIPNARILKNKKNKGFGAANNLALNQVQTPYSLLLNPDCITTETEITKLIAAADTYPNAAIISPHLIRKDGSIEVSYRWPHTHWISRGPQAEGACCVGFACGAALLLNMEVMREIGFFDEKFFLYYEDEDLCQRVFNQKKQIILIPDAEVTHFSRGSVKGKNPLKSEFIRGYHHVQSKLIFEHKHVSAVSAQSLRWKTLILAILTLLPRLLVPQPKYLARLIGRISGLCRSYNSDEHIINKSQTSLENCK
jgi:N-acetylglucosaminyl-diphospho-decaprenol L-rhamnosyltransferase